MIFVPLTKGQFAWGAKTEREAAALYNDLAREYHGEFARLNDLSATF